jgi:uncharacterized protein
MTVPRTYPRGVPCWVDCEVADLDAAERFYGPLFGWEFQAVAPDYRIATLAGADVAALMAGGAGVWNTYIAVDDADESAADVRKAGGSITVEPPEEPGPGGRFAGCADPGGAAFRLWEPKRRLGAQLVNAPGSWNFSNLRAPEPKDALPFYTAVFGWVADELPGAGLMVRQPGYGAHLAATSDPDIYQRQANAPEGFADVIAGIEQEDGPAHWHVLISVADRDASAAQAQRLGGTVLGSHETMWTRQARVRDPQGAEFSISQFTPPDGF